MPKTFLAIKKETIKRRARKRKMAYGLSDKFLQKLLSNPVCQWCKVFCNVETHAQHEKNDFSIDRINPLLGYTEDNVQVLCCDCNNNIKSVMDQLICRRQRQANRKQRNEARRKEFTSSR